MGGPAAMPPKRGRREHRASPRRCARVLGETYDVDDGDHNRQHDVPVHPQHPTHDPTIDVSLGGRIGRTSETRSPKIARASKTKPSPPPMRQPRLRTSLDASSEED